jgi:tetratricopeptide (TPR) repeat protein
MRDYNQALSIKPDYAAAYAGRGNVYKDEKNYPAAIADFGKAIELKPDDPAAYYSRGMIHQAMNDHRASIDDLSIAVGYRPDAPDPHHARGVSYMAVQEYKKALDDFQIAGTNKVNNYEAWALAGEAAECLGDRAQAAQAYRRALQINASSRLAYEGLKRVGGDA